MNKIRLQQRIWFVFMIAVAWLCGAAVVLAGDAIQPTLRINLSKQYGLDFWKDAETPIFHQTAKGRLVLLPGFYDPDKPRHALVSDDRGRTWQEWDGFVTWPVMSYSDVVRKDGELIALGHPYKDVFKGTWAWWSNDEGTTWKGGNRLTPDTDRWVPLNQRVLLTSRGRIIVPMDQLLGAEGPDPDRIGTIYSDDSGRSWRRSPIFGPPPPLPDRPEGFGEPAAVELNDGRIWMVFRARMGHLWQAWSIDGGATWGNLSSTGLISPLSAVNAKRIPGTDAVVVLWNRAKPGVSHNFCQVPSLWRPRSPLVFAVSHDNCKSWSEPVIVDPGTSIYPSLCFTKTELFVAYKMNPDPKAGCSAAYDLMLVAYDINGILNRKP